ncbi:MAG TPA: protein kinase [Polyangiaceae bacterium]|nr:protein kinase [Polyangiaceae bacterium]
MDDARDDPYLQAVAAVQDRPPPDGPASVHGASLPRSGQILAHKYRVERVLGVGGMGVVVAARHMHLDVPVALKFMTDEALAKHELVSRFLREARATARLRGEHVVRVSDVGTLDSGAPYMVMEYLQGLDLAALVARLGPPPIARAVEYAIQACEGLSEAHRAGFVHRDVKPSNLFLTQRPNGTACVKVLDFGISKAATVAGEIPLGTSTHAIFGSPLYMAPEQMRAARDVDARADVWSLGASLYELLAGVVPFEAQTLIDLAYRIANERPPSPRRRRPEIPWELEAVVMRCLEKDRERRFPDAESLATALRDLLPVRADAGDPSSDDKTIVSFEAPAEDLESSAEIATKMMPSAAESASVTEPLASVAEAPRSAGVVATLPSQSVTQAPTTELIEPIPTLPFGSPTAMPKPRAAPEVLKQSAVSWGRSQRLTRRPSRILWVLASAVGLGAATTAVVVVSRSGGGAPVASSPTATPLDTRLEAPVLRVETAPGKSESNQPSTVSVLDLPRVTPEPVAAASVATVRKVGVPPVRASGGEANVDAGRTVLANHAATAQVAAPRASAEKLDPLAP